MKHSNKVRGLAVASAWFVGLAALGVARSAQASPTFPPLLQQALEAEFHQSFCVPLCTACHQTTVGGPQMLNVFGTNLETYGLLFPILTSGDHTVGPAITRYFATPPPAGAPLNMAGEIDSDGDGVSDKDELIDGDSPSLPGARGKGQFCPDIKYGCAGGRIAAAPPVDNVALLSAGLVVAGFAVMRRRRRLAKRAR